MYAYLDQNKWIELARGVRDAARYPDANALIAPLFRAVNEGRLVLPLTFANLYETQKINDPRRRADVAYVQAMLSQGRVFRARASRLQREFASAIARATGQPSPDLPPGWFISAIFFEAVADLGDGPGAIRLPAKLRDALRDFPAEVLLDYLVEQPEPERKYAVQVFSGGSAELCASIELRRQTHKGESLSMRRRIYNVLLLKDTLALFFAAAREVGLPWQALDDVPPSVLRQVVREAPAFHVEREIVLRLEAQDRPVVENDLRDMQSFAAAIPYADMVVAEAHFGSLARQAKLHEAYAVRIETDLERVRDLL